MLQYYATVATERARRYVYSIYRALVYSVLLQALGIDAVDIVYEVPAFFESISQASAASSVPEDVEPPNGDEVMPTDSESL